MIFWEWLLLLFIALKLMGHITWSWWLVIGPCTLMCLFVEAGKAAREGKEDV